ncbi:hypothetical protein GN958_ATG15875 [Phytophthora infestans]|uniref:Cyclic nucleotide-binding domain-containing protein n=1 Tax=Phytophthora infestans TaxID=4787 RepID=A0A8S9U1Y4_PHYIN|nr:hypothetical protein GN958_ATG15875 [Phytophthora infestans]
MVASTLESGGGTGNSKAYPSKNSCVRLLTILFSEKYATRFAETGNKPTRQQLDVGDIHANSTFWREVALNFNGNRMDFNTLLSDDVRFAWFDCSVIVVQEVGTLYDMWKTVNQSYVKAMARFTKSGEHGDDFYSFCAGALDVFYLRECLQLKHNLTQFVEGGMFDEDQFDSLKRRSSAVAAVDTTSTPSKKNSERDCRVHESYDGKAMRKGDVGRGQDHEDAPAHSACGDAYRRAERCRKADGAPRGQSAVLPREAE